MFKSKSDMSHRKIFLEMCRTMDASIIHRIAQGCCQLERSICQLSNCNTFLAFLDAPTMRDFVKENTQELRDHFLAMEAMNGNQETILLGVLNSVVNKWQEEKANYTVTKTYQPSVVLFLFMLVSLMMSVAVGLKIDILPFLTASEKARSNPKLSLELIHTEDIIAHMQLPEEVKVQIQSELMNEEPNEIQLEEDPNESQVLLVSASNRKSTWVQDVWQNQETFSIAHGFKYEAINDISPYIENECILDNKVKSCEPQWTKINVMLQKLNNSRNSMVIWIDDDIVMMKKSNLFLEKYMVFMRNNNVHLLVSADSEARLSKTNTGIIIAQNTPEGKRALQEIWQKRLTNLGVCENQSCLHEQESLNLLLEDRSHRPTIYGNIYEGGILVVDQSADPEMNINTMYRKSHRDIKRDMNLFYDDKHKFNKEYSNTCHVSGMASVGHYLDDNTYMDLRRNMVYECLLLSDV